MPQPAHVRPLASLVISSMRSRSRFFFFVFQTGPSEELGASSSILLPFVVDDDKIERYKSLKLKPSHSRT